MNDIKLRSLISEAVRKALNEVELKGKSGKTYNLHGDDEEAWLVMQNLRAKQIGKNPKWREDHLRDLKNQHDASFKEISKKLKRMRDVSRDIKDGERLKGNTFKGKSGKTHRLDGRNPESWNILSNLRGYESDLRLDNDKSKRAFDTFIDLFGKEYGKEYRKKYKRAKEAADDIFGESVTRDDDGLLNFEACENEVIQNSRCYNDSSAFRKALNIIKERDMELYKALIMTEYNEAFGE